MRIFKIKSATIKLALAATVLLSASGVAMAQQVVNLTAAPANTTLSDGNVVPMWGYSCGTAAPACSASNPAVAAAQAAVAAGTATAAQTALAASWSPVVITVPSGQGLTINLTNNLTFANGNTVPTSLVIVGQLGGGLGTGATSTASPDHSTVRSQTWPIATGDNAQGTPAQAPAQGNRVQSFATEVAAAGATLVTGQVASGSSLTWASLQPGTYLIQSGTHPSIQVPMGLYGILVVTDAATGTAYGTAGAATAVTYNADIALLFSEIDPVQNTAVSQAVNTAGFSETKVWSGLPDGCGNPLSASGTANPAFHTCYPPAVNYTALYYLINGRTFDATNAAASLYPVNPLTGATGNVTGKVLVRLVNAGSKMHVPAIVGSQTTYTLPPATTPTTGAGMTLVAEDGNVLPGKARIQNEVFMAAGKTYDVLINAPTTVTTALPIYDRELSLSANATGRNGGMLAYIGVNGAGLPAATASGAIGAAVAKDDTYNALVPGMPLTISSPAKGVVGNDVRVYGVSVLTAPTGGTLALNANGTFTYTPNAGTTTDSFTYCANGTVTGGVCSSGVTATVTLGASNVLSSDTGVTCTPTSFTSTVATSLSIQTPGVLAGCKDGANLPVSVDPSSVSATGMTVVADANGGFIATTTTPGTYTFSFKAKNSLGVLSAATTATVTFPAGSNLSVTVLDGADHTTVISDYRWIIEEDRTFYVDPLCTTNPLPAGCPTLSGVAATTSTSSATINYGTNFHTSAMPVVAAGCTGPLSCESGQTLQGVATVCDVGNGVCRPGTQQNVTLPGSVKLDPSKRYYISILPGDAANPFIGGNASAPTNCAAGAMVPDPVSGQMVLNTDCGHGMGGAPIAAACGLQSASKATCTATAAFPAVTVLTVPTPLPTATLSVFVYQDDYPLNGEHGSGGGVDVLAPQEPGLGGFQVTIFDQAGGTGDATGQPTYDMFNQPLSNSLAGTIDPVTGLDACPVSTVASANAAYNANPANAADIAANGPKSTVSGLIITCPKYEADGQTLSPMAGQALVKNLYPGRYGIAALPGASRIALGEEWVQTNTLDGQKAHDSFMRVGEPGYFQEFGPAGFHVSIGFANPKVINERRYNDTKSGMCDTGAAGGNLACTFEVTGKVTGSRLSRAPDSRLYSSGSRDALAFTQCYVSLGDPDGAEIAFSKCDSDGNFDFKGIPAGNWKITTFDQWNDQIIDGITQPVAVGCGNNVGGLCTKAAGGPNPTTCAGTKTTTTVCDMGEIGVHQWQANIYTRSFIDVNGDGVSQDPGEPGLALVATNVRFRDGSYSNFNNTDLNGYAGFNEVFPLFNWYTIETDSTRYKTTGVHVVYDAGGPADNPTGKYCDPVLSPCGNSSIGQYLANTYEKYPLPPDLSVPGAVYCADADCTAEVANGGIAQGPVKSSTTMHSTGRIDPPTWFGSYGWQGYIGQGNFLEFGKKPFAAGETGPIHGHVVYASTRPFDDPQLLLQLSWEPMIAHVRVNLYKEDVAADGVTPTLTLVDHTDTSSWDDWVQGFRSDGKPNMSCPGQQGNTDPFFYGLQNQPQYLDWYNSQHGGPAPTALPYNSQYKCYDGMHTWNQLQPAPYDGIFSFPSVTGTDPVTGNTTGTNCTICVKNPDTTDAFRNGKENMLPAGKYVVEVVVPPGYELVKEEDKNILIGDNYIAPAAVQIPGLGSAVYILPDQAQLSATYNPLNAQNSTTSLGRNSALPSHEGDTGSIETYWPCVGEVRQVPDFISLFPGSAEVAPFAGAYRPLCDRKEVTLDPQSSVLTKFYLFSSTHVSAHFQGIILDDFAAEFDPFSPQFGEKFAPSYLPVGVKDWTGNAVNRVYTDQFGLYNGLNYSTWEVNPPNPTGYGPTMMTMCMNDAGLVGAPDPLFQPGYSQFCYELPFMPGQTGYFDTPVVPVQAFASGSYNRPDCAYPDATPAVSSVTGDVAGPWVSAPAKTLTINALGPQSVDWYGYSGPSTTTTPYNQQKITRHYGFGGAQGLTGKVTIGGVTAPVLSWSDTTITVTVPSGVPACAVQQQSQYGGLPASCGQLVITTAAGKQSIDTVTVTIGGKTPTVLAAGATIQSAIDAAQPGDMIIVPAGTYNEMLVMWKPIRLQGVGAASSVVDANTQPSGTLLNPWRQKIVCLFGLTIDGRPDTSGSRSCVNGLVDATNNQTGTTWMNFPTMVADRLPFEATLGWDASLNGNLAEQMIEPSLLGAYEGAAITVIGKGVKFPVGTSILDAFGATTGTPGASFPTNTTLLSNADCGSPTTPAASLPYPTNFYCNPSSIDGLGVRDSSQGGGGIFVHAYAHNLQIANNRVSNNTGTMSGGMTIGTGEHPDVALGGPGQTITSYPTSCETSNIANLSLPFCFNTNVNIHHNAVIDNSSMGDELFSSTPAGAGGVSINTGSDRYKFTNNWVCGNLSSGDGGGVSHIGFIKNGDIEHNTIIFNQSTNPSITTNGGGLLVMGAPDADPTTCGVATDLDCLPPPATITPSDGSGPGLVINANLILGNAADSGSGGGLRMQHINGTDVLNRPNGANDCLADLSKCYWNSVNVTNNIIVNNVAGWDGAGVSLLDALAVNIVNNTIASNDSTASSGTLFQALYAPLASSAAPTTNVICGATNGQSCPQVAGLVSVNDSPVLAANINLLSTRPNNNPFRCPSGHGQGNWTGNSYTGTYSAPSCVSYSVPVMLNDVLWQNRSFYIGVGGKATGPNQNQQNQVTLFPKGSNTPAASQPQAPATTVSGAGIVITGGTGACVGGSSYWDLGFRGDTTATSHAASGFAPNYSVVSAAATTTYGGSSNRITSPSFTTQYCNGSRSPPELGTGGYAVPPGVNEFNAFPNPVFSLNPAGVVDEGNNWVNVNWGPLAFTNPATGAVLGNYAPTAAQSSAVNFGTNSQGGVAAPKFDFFGNVRPAGTAYDIGAVEVGALPPLPKLSVTPTSLTFTAAYAAGPPPVAYSSAAQTLTLSNTGNAPSNLGGLVFPNTAFSRPTGAAGGTCGTTLNNGATCTINVVFTPTALGTVTSTLAISADVAVTGSPVALSGTGVAPVISATLTPTTWNTYHAANCPGTGILGILQCLLDPAQVFTLTNTGNVPLTGIAQGVLGGTAANAANWTIVRLMSTCGPAGNGQLVPTVTLAAGASCNIAVQFKPLTTQTSGAKPATLSVTDSAGTQTSTLNGTDGLAAVTFAVPTLTTTPATTTTKTGTVTVSNAATATGPLLLTANPTIAKVGAAGGAFSITGGTCVSGASVAAGASCTISVQYVPPANGTTATRTATATAHVTISGNLAAPGTQTSANFTAN